MIGVFRSIVNVRVSSRKFGAACYRNHGGDKHNPPDLAISPVRSRVYIVNETEEGLVGQTVISKRQTPAKGGMRNDPLCPGNPIQSHCLVHGVEVAICEGRVRRYRQITEGH